MTAPDRPVLVVDNFDSFVYNLVQYLGQLGVRCIVRRNDAVTRRRARRARRRRGAALPRPRHALGRRRHRADGAGRGRGRHARLRGLPGPPGDRRGLRRRGGARSRAAARQDQRGHPRRGRRPRGAALAVHGDPLPLPRRRPGDRSGRARGHRHHAVGHRDGAAPPASCRSRASSSTPSRCSPRAGTGCWRPGWPSAAWRPTRPWSRPRVPQSAGCRPPPPEVLPNDEGLLPHRGGALHRCRAYAGGLISRAISVSGLCRLPAAGSVPWAWPAATPASFSSASTTIDRREAGGAQSLLGSGPVQATHVRHDDLLGRGRAAGHLQGDGRVRDVACVPAPGWCRAPFPPPRGRRPSPA